LSALQAELGGSSYVPSDDVETEDIENDPYAKYYEDEDEEA
jgi:hypothetical protein